MPTLLLLRHAKSSWKTGGRRDFERSLAPRGQRAAALMGGFLAEHDLMPDLVLCSAAVRAKTTLDLALPHFAGKPEIRYLEELYLTGPRKMLALLRSLEAAPDRILLIGHNPGFHALSLLLSGTGAEDELSAMAAKFPTAALAVIDFPGPWADIAASTGHLRLFATPRLIAQNSAP